MLLIVGLGNPGEQYNDTRHNIGRETAEKFARDAECPPFVFEKKLFSRITKNKTKYIVVLPDTFMNESGKAVRAIIAQFKINPKKIFVIHDDTDIALGKTKLSFGRNSAGHKGVESVTRALKTKDFWRFRIGVAGKKNVVAEKLVLKKWSTEEKKIILKMQKKTIIALNTLLTQSPEHARNEYNQ